MLAVAKCHTKAKKTQIERGLQIMFAQSLDSGEDQDNDKVSFQKGGLHPHTFRREWASLILVYCFICVLMMYI